jgi:DHA1 family bicyclomycin/chloramphenicol resistance-like MFS transporter
MQQTLSVYMLCFGLMCLWHGPLSDRYGRKPVLLVALAVFVLASWASVYAQSIEALLFWRAWQGFSAGAGTIIGRAIVRDVATGAHAQRMMSQVTLVFALGPAIAPVLGGYLHEWAGWRSIYLFMLGFSLLVLLLTAWKLPETLPASARQDFSFANSLKNYLEMSLNPRARWLVLAAGANFAALFLVISASAAIVFEHLALGSKDFHYLFLPLIGGILLGSQISGLIAERLKPRKQVWLGYLIMSSSLALHFVVLSFGAQSYPWPILFMCSYGVGSSLAFPVLTIKLMDLFPARRGAASSMQTFVSLMLNCVVAGVAAPLLQGSLWLLALGQLVLMSAGLCAWLCYLRAASVMNGFRA